ncbi:MAG: hypothetical protein QW046_02045, partial [Candidatus Micrarchaeaceae archaeon]
RKMIIINLYSKNKKVSFISIDVRKKLLYLEHIQGKGQSEPKVAEKHIKESNKKYKIKKFFGDSEYDTNNMFDIIQSVGAETAIKIRKNAAPVNIRGSKIKKK